MRIASPIQIIQKVTEYTQGSNAIETNHREIDRRAFSTCNLASISLWIKYHRHEDLISHHRHNDR